MDNVEDYDIDGGLANVRPAKDRTSFVVYPAQGYGPSFTVSTLHISCKSDTYHGSEQKYGGIIIYSRDGQTDWRTANNTHCKSGYVVIMQTDTKAFKDLQAAWSYEPGQVHGIQKSVWRILPERSESGRRRFWNNEWEVQDYFRSVQSCR